MSITYNPLTNYAAKDTLPANNPDKVVRGVEFTADFDAISSAFATAAPAANPVFTGNATFDTLSVTSTAVMNDMLVQGIITDGGAAGINFTGGGTPLIAGFNIDASPLGLTTPATVNTTALSLNGVAVTATAAELNIMDGVTATTAELNILDGVTATTVELNYVDGVTSGVQTQIDTKAPIASPTFTGTSTVPSLVLATGATVTAILDEDDLVSDSPTALATQQSIKAYVDDLIIPPGTVTRQQFTGDGTTTVFTLSADLGSLGASLQVFIDGVYQEEAGYTVAGTALTFSEAPPVDSTLETVAFAVAPIGQTSANLVSFDPTGTGVTATNVQDAIDELSYVGFTRQQFTGDGATTVFTLAEDPGANSGALNVYIDGFYQEASTFSTVGTALTFSEAPPLNSAIETMVYQMGALGTTTSNLVTYVPAGAGAVATSVQGKLRETVSVKDFGAVGDGVTDDTAAIQAALDSVSAGGIVEFGKAHVVSARIFTTFTGDVSLVGKDTEITATGSVSSIFRLVNQANHTSFSGFSINGSNTVPRGVEIEGEATVTNNTVFNMYATYASGISAMGIFVTAFAPATNTLVSGNSVYNIKAEDAGSTGEGAGSSAGIYVSATAAALDSVIRVSNNKVADCFSREGTSVYCYQTDIGAADEKTSFYINDNKLGGANRRNIKAQVRHSYILNNVIDTRDINDTATASAISSPAICIGILGDTVNFADSCVCSGNVINNYGGVGETISAEGDNHVISDNKIYRKNAQTLVSGITLQDSNNGLVTGNYIELTNAAFSAVDFDGTYGSTNNVFSENTVVLQSVCRSIVELASSTNVTQLANVAGTVYANNTFIDETDADNFLGVVVMTRDGALGSVPWSFVGNTVTTVSTNQTRARLLYIGGAFTLTSNVYFVKNYIGALGLVFRLSTSPDTTKFVDIDNVTWT